VNEARAHGRGRRRIGEPIAEFRTAGSASAGGTSPDLHPLTARGR